ncbi:lactate utilization protein [Candidatus Woesearchaeota archaeon]|nr:lactate utilization protein [Candidatus Woesearchaeota archaeon]
MALKQNIPDSKPRWDVPADESSVEKAAAALKENGMKAYVAEDGKAAFEKVFELIPAGSEVMDLTSATLDETGISKEIQESGRYVSVKKRIMSVDQKDIRETMRRMSAAVDYAIGSVHAVTEDGKVVIASASGSQIPPYAFGARKLIWVVGTQKIVKNLDEAFKRIYEHSFPLEDQRARKAYGMPSSVSKLLIVEKEANPDRISVILVKEKLGF